MKAKMREHNIKAEVLPLSALAEFWLSNLCTGCDCVVEGAAGVTGATDVAEGMADDEVTFVIGKVALDSL